MDDYLQISNLKYEFEHDEIRHMAIKGGMIWLADCLRCSFEYAVNHGYYIGTIGFLWGSKLEYNTLNAHDKKLLARVWKWLYPSPHEPLASIIKNFS